MAKRGIVMEVKGKKVIVLTEYGEFREIRMKRRMTPEIGDPILVPQTCGHPGPLKNCLAVLGRWHLSTTRLLKREKTG